MRWLESRRTFLGERLVPLERRRQLQQAFAAHHAGRYDEAATLWDAVRARWPDTPIAWCGSAANRRELGRLHEARAIIADARRRFPADLVTITEAIRIHDAFGDAEAALQLSAAMVRLDPSCATWRLGHFDRLLAADRTEDAAAALEASPRDGGWQLRAALLALRRGDRPRVRALLDAMGAGRADAIAEAAAGLQLRHPAESLVLFDYCLEVEPDRASHLRGVVGGHLGLGAHDDAATVLDRALERHPDDPGLLKARAKLAIATERFADALADLHRLLAATPSDRELAELAAHARLAAATAQAERDEAAPPQPSAAPMVRQEIGHVANDAARELLLGYESLGQDCEFGLLQRRYGAEPLGLFRWNFCETARLADALSDGLDGVGAAAQSVLRLWDHQEYYLEDLRYGFTVHAWQNKGTIAADVLFPKMCTRVALLRRKLLEDLASGRKILVHKTFATGIDDVRALARSLRAHGPNILLWVRSMEHEASPEAPGRGTVTEIEPGLLTAHLSSFGNRVGAPWQIRYDEWLAICAAAAALVRDAPPVSALLGNAGQPRLDVGHGAPDHQAPVVDQHGGAVEVE